MDRWRTVPPLSPTSPADQFLVECLYRDSGNFEVRIEKARRALFQSPELTMVNTVTAVATGHLHALEAIPFRVTSYRHAARGPAQLALLTQIR